MTDYQLRIMLESVRLYLADRPDATIEDLVAYWHDLEAAEWPRST